MKYDFVVIGAGASGITSAITLAKNGYRVALVEKANQTAPLIRGFLRRGVHFDTGFHYTGGFGVGEPLDIFFRYLGISDRITSFAFNENKFDLFRCEEPAFEFGFPTGITRLQEKLCDTFPSEHNAICSYLEQVRSICSEMPYLNLDAEITANSALSKIMGRTLRETLDALTGNELLKSLLSVHCLLYGVSSKEVSFAHHAAIVGTYYNSVRGIRGGGKSLADAFDIRLDELGIDVICSREVTRVKEAHHGGISGVMLSDGTMLSCKAVVATVHPRILLDIAPQEAFRPAYRQRLSTLEDTISAFVLFATCKEPIPSLAGSNKLYLPNAHCIHELGDQPVGEAPLYLSAAYRPGEIEPTGFICISPTLLSESSLYVPSGGRRPDGYRNYKTEVLERMQNQIRRAFPEIAEKTSSIECSTPFTIRDFCGGPKGGLYGVKHMLGQYNPHSATKMPGLFLAGQAVVAPGVIGAMISGFLACGTILGHDLMRRELNACC